MKRISSTWLSLGCALSLCALATACSSGGDDDDDSAAAGTSSGNSSSGGSSSNGGSSSPTAGTSSNGGSSSPTAGTSSSGGSDTAGTSSGGTSSGGSGNTAPSVCDNSTFELPVGEAYIDNFETDTRFDGWYSFSDTTPPNMPMPERVMPGALDSMYAGHITATGIKSSKMMGYGAGFGFGLVDPAKGACVDVSAFKGISFWIKGSVGTDDTLKFQVVSPLTQPADSMPVGDCPSSASACAFKHPAKTIMVTADWSHVVINFADLSPASAFNGGKILGFNMITDGPDYDVDIDEVTFFTDSAPEGTVMPDTGAGGASM